MIRDSCNILNYFEISEGIRLILEERMGLKTTINKGFIVNQRHFFWETIYNDTHNLVLLMLRVSA